MTIDYRQRALDYLRSHGPSVPVAVGKHLGTNSMLAGAVLSDLKEKGELRISRLKVGGSPLYYLQGQETDLLKFRNHLDAKEREVLTELEQRQVMRENACSPLQRVALRNSQDFAIPLDVTFKGGKETFWKWFAVPDADAEGIIRSMINPQSEEAPAKKTATHPTQQQSLHHEAPMRPAPVQSTPTPSRVTQTPTPKTTASPTTQTTVAAPAAHVPTPQHAPATAPLPQSNLLEEQQHLAPPQASASDDFLMSLHRFFAQNNIKIVSQQCVKKKAEYDFVLRLPSSVGELTYYCKAKSKRRISDMDISAAFVQGQLRKLPVLFLSPGELAKKAQELISHELHALTYKRVEQ